MGVATDKNVAAIVEVNCETDFVAKADDFKSLVSNRLLRPLYLITKLSFLLISIFRTCFRYLIITIMLSFLKPEVAISMYPKLHRFAL